MATTYYYQQLLLLPVIAAECLNPAPISVTIAPLNTYNINYNKYDIILIANIIKLLRSFVNIL